MALSILKEKKVELKSSITPAKFKEYSAFVGRKYLKHLCSGKILRLGYPLGTCVPYKTDNPATFHKSAFNWNESVKAGKPVFYEQPSFKYRISVKVFMSHSTVDTYKSFYPRIWKGAAKEFFEKAAQNIDKFIVATRNKHSFFPLEDSGPSRFHSFYNRDDFTKGVLRKAGCDILGLEPNQCLVFADAYAEAFFQALYIPLERTNGSCYMNILQYSSNRTELRYKLFDRMWDGEEVKFEKDGFVESIIYKHKKINATLFRRSPSRAILNVMRLCKREKPLDYLDSEKTILWTHNKLLENGENGVPLSYIRAVEKRFHKRYLHLFRRSFVYKRLGKVNGEGESS